MLPADLMAHRKEIAGLVADSSAVLIAGGHVELLLNRLRLFDLATGLKARPVIAWSAGAMALSERIVLFHDNPPQGAGIAEVADRGLGLFSGVLPLPHAGKRLRLHDSERVSLFARRFAPARCSTLEDGTALTWTDDRLTDAVSAFRLTRSGALRPVKAA
jgi:peptidase E